METVRKSGPPGFMLTKCSTPQRMTIIDIIKPMKGKTMRMVQYICNKTAA